MCLMRIMDLISSNDYWGTALAPRERKARKELRRLKKAYEPILKKAQGDERESLWAEYSAQCEQLEHELLSIAIRRLAIDVPEQWVDSRTHRYFSQTQDTKAENAIKRKIRDERLKGMAITVSILSLFVAILALLVGFVSIVWRSQ